jgi:hypothetical protein
MPADVAATLALWSSTDGSNSPSGTTSVSSNLDDNLQRLQGVVVRGLSHKGADIASATTTDLGAVEGLFHDITGVITITGFGTVRAGIWKILKFEGALTLTHNATSLILPGGANITTAVGDMLKATSEGGGNWRVNWYTRADGKPVVDPAASDTVAGKIEIAVQSEMETGTSTAVAVTPGRQHFHPSASKGWVRFNGISVAINVSYNVTSITDNGAGDYTINWTTPFSAAGYACGWMTNSNVTSVAVASQTAASLRITTSNTEGTGALLDLDNIQVIAFGDL